MHSTEVQAKPLFSWKALGWALLYFWFFSTLLQAIIYISGYSGTNGIRDSLLFSSLWLIPIFLFPKRIKIIAAVIGVVLWAASLAALCYYVIYGQEFSQSVLFVMFETNTNEASEYLSQYFSLKIVLIALAYTAVAVLLWTRLRPVYIPKPWRYVVSFALLYGLILHPIAMNTFIKNKPFEKTLDNLASRMEPAAPWQFLTGYYQYRQQLNSLTKLLNENNAFQLFVDKEEDLAGLPEWFCQSAAEEAKAAGQEGKWLFTLHNASRLPFLQYSENRPLREKIYKAYTHRGNNDDKNDNKKVITQIVSLRLEKANLLGFDCYSNFVLENTMAKNSTTVMEFLNNLWNHSLPKAKAEAVELQKLMDKEGKGEKLEAWDWWYYTEKLRKEKYNLDEEEIKPYFKLENVREGAFAVANKLYGITLTKLQNIPVYHPDVEVFEVKDADGSHLGIFYVDYFPRPGKSGGAWMSNYREQQGDIRPLVCNVASFTKPIGDTPSLLTMDEVETLFHEFGHGLHGLLTKCNYKGTSGTNVVRDFVELPSQINEHWGTEPEVLKMYGKHYQTGETMPDALIQKIQESGHFNQGFVTVEYVAAALLDMDWYSNTEVKDFDVNAFEKASMDKYGLIREILPRYRSTYFSHIFDGGYSAGYYVYLWAEVLDADAFQAFKSSGDIYNKELAAKFRKYVLSGGGYADPMQQYIKFRGQEPSEDPLLHKRGLK